MRWFVGIMESAFEVKTHCLGEGPGCEREITVLNRTIRLVKEGLEYEADPKHVATLVDRLGIKDGHGSKIPGRRRQAAHVERNRAC